MEVLEQPTAVLEQFVAGDLSAFETLFRQHQHEVYPWIVRIVRDPAMAEDLTVETFWRIYRAHARFDPARSFGAWARRIATNVALDYLKSARARMDRQLGQAEEQSAENLPANPVPDRLLQRETRQRIERAFWQLPPKLQAVAALALIEEQPHSEIAEALNISKATVKTRLFRAVRLLRKKLSSLGVRT
jgi:RNA polymerase sigma factor (sigma-70 family)